MTRCSVDDLNDWFCDLVESTEHAASRAVSMPRCLSAVADEEGHHQPDLFWTRCARALVARAAGSSRSAVLGWYCLFHELGERHVAAGSVAVVEYGTGTGFSNTSYAELVRSAGHLAESWLQSGLVAGDAVCIVLPMGVAFVRCLLATWYCGAVVSIVPPDGPEFVRRALLALRSDPKTHEPIEGARVYGVFGQDAEEWVRGQEGVEPLTWAIHTAAGSPSPAPHRYAAEEPAARFFSPLYSDWDAPVYVSAEQLYLGALRDAFLFRLVAGEGVAAPAACEVSLKPVLLFATLASGASWVELALEEVADGSALFEGRVQVLAISNELRARLRDLPRFRPGRVTRWLRNVAEDDDYGAWEALQKKLAEAGILGMNLFANAAAGGVILFSRWSALVLNQGTWLAPGLLCELTEANGTHMPTLSDVGMITPLESFEAPDGFAEGLSDAAMGRIVVARGASGHVWVTNLGSHWEGKVLPEVQIEELLHAEFTETARAAVLVVLPTRQSSSRERVQLVVFARPSATDPLSVEAVRDFLQKSLGANWVPKDVRVFEVNPKLVDPKKPNGEIDRPGCVGQYLSGTVWLKQRCGAVFRELARLSARV
jgi:hypothetical protein